MTKKVNNNENVNMVNNETKVMCPVCGTEFAIGEHEHKVKNATVIGADSGLGEVYLPVSKRGDALKAAGVDVTKYFSINLPTGGTQMMKMNEQGVPVAVGDNDPIMQAIAAQGTVPNRSLFRRWVMSQVFHWLMFDERPGKGNWLKWHGYKYQWEMLVEELRVQAKLFGRDMENYRARNRWFDKALAIEMADDAIKQMRKDANGRKTHKCKGVPYVKFDSKNVFVSDIEKKIMLPLIRLRGDINRAKTPQQLYEAVGKFWCEMPKSPIVGYKQCAAWKDAYKGMGAYATMQNLLRFHGCTFPKGNTFYKRGKSGLEMLDDAAVSYSGEGWRLWGVMKQMLDENGIDIKAKMEEWRKAKEAKRLNR